MFTSMFTYVLSPLRTCTRCFARILYPSLYRSCTHYGRAIPVPVHSIPSVPACAHPLSRLNHKYVGAFKMFVRCNAKSQTRIRIGPELNRQGRRRKRSLSMEAPAGRLLAFTPRRGVVLLVCCPSDPRQCNATPTPWTSLMKSRRRHGRSSRVSTAPGHGSPAQWKRPKRPRPSVGETDWARVRGRQPKGGSAPAPLSASLPCHTHTHTGAVPRPRIFLFVATALRYGDCPVDGPSMGMGWAACLIACKAGTPVSSAITRVRAS